MCVFISVSIFISSNAESRCSFLHDWQGVAVHLYRLPAPAKDGLFLCGDCHRKVILGLGTLIERWEFSYIKLQLVLTLQKFVRL